MSAQKLLVFVWIMISYFFLSFTLPFTQIDVLDEQHLERQDNKFSRKCLFCKVMFHGNRYFTIYNDVERDIIDQLHRKSNNLLPYVTKISCVFLQLPVCNQEIKWRQN